LDATPDHSPPAFVQWRLEQTEPAFQLCSEPPHHRNIVRTEGAEILSASTCRTRNARRDWLTTVRSMSPAAYLDLSARACHPAAGAGPSASAPRTAGSSARRCVVVPHAERAREEQNRKIPERRRQAPIPLSSSSAPGPGHPAHCAGCASAGTRTRIPGTPFRRWRSRPPPPPVGQPCLPGWSPLTVVADHLLSGCTSSVP